MNTFNKEQIEFEAQRFHIPYMEELTLTYDYIIELFKYYNLFEHIIHFYDSSPDECEKCDRLDYDDNVCGHCEIANKWNGSKEQLQRECWIDVFGPGIWGQSQVSCNNAVKEQLLEIVENSKEIEDIDYRIWVHIKDDLVSIFYYHRDLQAYDDWYVFKKKEG